MLVVQLIVALISLTSATTLNASTLKHVLPVLQIAAQAHATMESVNTQNRAIHALQTVVLFQSVEITSVSLLKHAHSVQLIVALLNVEMAFVTQRKAVKHVLIVAFLYVEMITASSMKHVPLALKTAVLPYAEMASANTKKVVKVVLWIAATRVASRQAVVIPFVNTTKAVLVVLLTAALHLVVTESALITKHVLVALRIAV